MSPVKEQLLGIIDYLSESKQALLLALAKEQSAAFRKDYIGQNAAVLFEESREINGVICQVGYTGEYIRAAKKTGEELSGKIVTGKLTGALEDNLLWLE